MWELEALDKSRVNYILRALLVSGLSPSTWRIFTSEEQPPERYIKMASARRRIWADATCFFLQTWRIISNFFSALVTRRRHGALVTTLELLDKQEVSEEAEPEDRVTSSAEEAFRFSDIRMSFERLFLTTCAKFVGVIYSQSPKWLATKHFIDKSIRTWIPSNWSYTSLNSMEER